MDSLLSTRTYIHASLHRKLAKAGDWVFIRLCPYRQVSIRSSYTKFSKRYYGSFLILERIRPVAYRLQLSPTSKIYPVFHVSSLKPYQGIPPSTLYLLPPAQADNHLVVEPLSILEWKLDNSSKPPTHKVLVQWLRMALEDTTWED